MRILITGSTGFIGQECCKILRDKDIHFFSYNKNDYDLLYLQDIKKMILHTRPSHILHLAWYTEPNYAQNEKNIAWLNAGKELIKAFAAQGGQRFVGVGTSFEYVFNDDVLCVEEVEPNFDTIPHTLYGRSKLELSNFLQEYAIKKSFSWAWCRPFYVFGVNEPKHRLFSAASKAFAKDYDFVTNALYRTMDFIDVKDAAKSLINILLSDYSGRINVGTGKGNMVQDLLHALSQKFAYKGKILSNEVLDKTPPIVADIKNLSGVQSIDSFSSLDKNLTDYYNEYQIYR